MSKVILDLNSQQIEKIVESLSIDEKLQLVRRLEKETMDKRWTEILRNIDKQLKKFPISKKEIAKEITSYRKDRSNCPAEIPQYNQKRGRGKTYRDNQGLCHFN